MYAGGGVDAEPFVSILLPPLDGDWHRARAADHGIDGLHTPQDLLKQYQVRTDISISNRLTRWTTSARSATGSRGMVTQ